VNPWAAKLRAYLAACRDAGMPEAKLAEAIDAYHREHHPLGFAIWNHDVASVRTLLSGGADPNAPDILGSPVLHDVVNDPDLVALLLAAGADPNAADSLGWTALIKAANGGNTDSVRVLLAHGADPTHTTMDGYTAFGRVPGQHEMLQQLLQAAEARWRDTR
jgi:ankyrin repeat protein